MCLGATARMGHTIRHVPARRDLADALQVRIAKGRKHKAGKPFLSGNYAPVRDEAFAEALAVEEGAMPQELDGVFLRNGPNPFYDPIAGAPA